MSRFKKLTTIAAVAALALGLAACGGGGDDDAMMDPPPPPPMEYDVALPDGHGLNDGMTSIGAGETVTLSDGTEITCTGTAACVLTVSTDTVTGVTSASSTGGMVAVTTEAGREAERIAEMEETARLALEMAQGEVDAAQEALDAVKLREAAGDATPNEVAAAETRLTTAMDALAALMPEPPPEPDPVPVAVTMDLELSKGAQDALRSSLAANGATAMLHIAAGETETREGVDFSCTSENACTVTLTNNVGTIVASWSTMALPDATPTVTVSYTPAPTPVEVALHGSMDLAEGTTTIPAGGSEEVDDTTISCAEGGEACVITVEVDDVTGAHSATSTGGMVTVAYNPPPQPPSFAAQRRARRLADRMSLRPFGDFDDDDATPDTRQAADTLPAFLRDGGLVAADDTATPPVQASLFIDDISATAIDEDGDSDTDSMYSVAASKDTSGTDYTGNHFTRDLPGGATDHVIVFSNQEPDETESFAMAYGGLGALGGDGNGRPDADAEQDGAQSPDDEGVETSPEERAAYDKANALFLKTVRTVDFADKLKPGSGDYNGAPTIGDGDDPVDDTELPASRAQFWKLAESSHFPVVRTVGTTTEGVDFFGPGQDPDNVGADPDDVNPNGEMVPGTFDGVAGNFECRNAMGCTVRRSATTGLSSHEQNAPETVADWQFIASTSTASVDTKRPDGDYLTLGFWRLAPQYSTGTHRFATFFTGRDPFEGDQDAINALEGKATYEGPAWGLYSARSQVSEGVFADTEGVFSATAKLTADFGGDPDVDTPDTDAGSISGTVSGFTGDHGYVEDWHVVLGSVDLDTAVADGMFSGSTIADNSRANGRHFTTGAWSGQFYGNNVATGQPGSVAGQFDAGWGRTDLEFPFHAAVAGVFGADYVPPPTEE